MISPAVIYVQDGYKGQKDNASESAFKCIINGTGVGNYHH